MKKCIALAASVTAGALAVSGCSGSSKGVSYGVKGTVEQKWMDYDCHKASGVVEADPAAYAASKKPTQKSGSGPRSSSGSTTDRHSSPAPAVTKSSPIPAPLKVDKVPTGKPLKPKGFSAKWCTEEPELFIRNRDGVFEQDVLRDHYDVCDRGEKFPKCTK